MAFLQPLYRGIVQLVEYRSPKPQVVGSNPTAPAILNLRPRNVDGGFFVELWHPPSAGSSVPRRNPCVQAETPCPGGKARARKSLPKRRKSVEKGRESRHPRPPRLPVRRPLTNLFQKCRKLGIFQKLPGKLLIILAGEFFYGKI